EGPTVEAIHPGRIKITRGHGFLANESTARKSHARETVRTRLANEAFLMPRTQTDNKNVAVGITNFCANMAGLLVFKIPMVVPGNQQGGIALFELIDKTIQLCRASAKKINLFLLRFGALENPMGDGGEVETDPDDFLARYFRQEIRQQHSVAEESGGVLLSRFEPDPDGGKVQKRERAGTV